MNLRERHQEIESRLEKAARASGRERRDLTLVAVSKTWPAPAVRAAYELGVRGFGENYAQEALGKKQELKDLAIDWHFIGHLQSNKVKSVVGEFSLIHSVDRLSLAQEISSRTQAEPDTEAQGVLIEINIGDEAGKSGISLGELPRFVDEIQELPALQLRGLMVMPPLDWGKDELRRAFNQVRDERDRLLSRLSAPHNLLELSMGTSNDFVEAVEAGATIVRLGTALFGKRE